MPSVTSQSASNKPAANTGNAFINGFKQTFTDYKDSVTDCLKGKGDIGDMARVLTAPYAPAVAIGNGIAQSFKGKDSK